jgi:NhaC family Na+:H+ antiporter
VALALFAASGIVTPATATAVDTSGEQAALASVFWISPLNLLPLLLLFVMSVRRAPAFLAIFASALFAGVLACFTQWSVVSAFVGRPDQGPILVGIEAIYKAMATGFVSDTGNPTIDALFTRGGMASMLTTVWLILGALSFAGIMEDAGFLERLIRPVVAKARSTGQLIMAVLATAFALNVVAGDQYVADVLPSRLYRDEFARRRNAPRMLSRAVEDSGTVTSPLVPWNTCGAYMAGVLGVATAAYLPFCFFNIASPLISLIYGFTGFRIEHLPPADIADTAPPTARLIDGGVAATPQQPQ